MTYLIKAITFKNFYGTFLASAFATVITLPFIKELVGDIPSRDFLIPLFIAGIFFIGYGALVALDTLTGIKAAKIEGQKLEKEKLKYIIYKITSHLVLSIGLLIMQGVIRLALPEFVYATSVWASTTLFILVSGFEFHSVGENLERIYGVKPKMFSLLERILSIVELKFFDKLKQ